MIDLKEYVDIACPGITFNQQYKVNKKGDVISPYRGWHKISLQKYKKGI